MERNTRTAFGSLQPGDRFYFEGGDKVVFELTEQHHSRSYYNDVFNGKKMWTYDKQAPNSKGVVFLRNAKEPQL